VNAGLRVSSLRSEIPGASFARRTCLARRRHPRRPGLPVARAAPRPLPGHAGAGSQQDSVIRASPGFPTV